MHEGQLSICSKLALRVDVLGPGRDGSEDAMHHLISVVEKEDWHPAIEAVAFAGLSRWVSNQSWYYCGLKQAHSVVLIQVATLCQMQEAYPSFTCCTQFQFEAGSPNTNPVVHSLRVSAVAPASETYVAGIMNAQTS